MQSTFWSNTIWYVGLGISTLIELIIIFLKVKNRKLLTALFFSISGMAFSFEAAVMFFFEGYKYYPMIIPQLPFDDMAVGNFFSQFSLTSTALLIAILDKKYYWYFICAVIYSVIEELFIKLGIYSHNWYQTWMTFVGVVLLCGVTKKIYKSSLSGIKRGLLYIYVFFSFFTLYLISLLWIFKVSGIIDFNLRILPNELRSYTVLAVSNMLIITIPCIIIYFSKLQWIWRSIVIAALYLIVFIEYRLKLIFIRQGWFLIYTTIEIFGTYLYLLMLDTLFGNKKNI